MNEDEAFVCLNNFYINPEEDKVTCLAKFGNEGENMRIPLIDFFDENKIKNLVNYIILKFLIVMMIEFYLIL